MTEIIHGERPLIPDSVIRDRQHITEVLTMRLVPYITPDIPRDNDGSLSVLSVGCGFGMEAKPIIDTVKDSTYLGIDIAERSIMHARFFNKDLEAIQKIQFAQQDIRVVTAKQFGVVVVRHPPVYGFRKVLAERGENIGWEPELNASIDHLSINGLLFITTEDDYYYKGLLEYITKKNLAILSKGENEAARQGLSLHHDQFSITAQRLKD